ncbi:MAG: hypothetical protein ACK4UN_09735 [Limisphaerales bacterium]
MCREKRVKIGQEVVLKNLENSYFLPKGLEEGSKAIVRGTDYGSLIIEQDGKEWRISNRCIEHEMEYEVKRNCWLPRDHPMTIKAMEEEKKLNLTNKRTSFY